MKKHFKSFQSELVAMVILLFALFAVLTDLMFANMQRRYMLNHYHNSQMSDASVIAARLSSTRGISEDSTLGALLGESGYQYDLALYESLIESNLWIFDKNGTMYANTEDVIARVRNENVDPLLLELSQKVMNGYDQSVIGTLDGTEVLISGKPVVIDGENAGCVLVSQSISNLNTDMYRQSRTYLLAQFAAFVLAAIIALIFAHRFTDPVIQIEHFAQRLAQGNYEERTTIDRQDEVGLLAQSMDDLAQRLSEVQQQREQQEENKKKFLAEISHELKTPVAVIRGSLEELMENRFQSEQDVQDYYQMMNRETAGLQKQIESLLDLARLQTLDYRMDRERMDFTDVLSDALMSGQAMAHATDRQILFNRPEGSFFIYANYDRIRQLLMILIDNALRYSPPDSCITVEFDVCSGRFSISNEGEPIPVERREEIFHAYSRIRKDQKGTGLGLAIAGVIAQRHGYQLYAAGQQEGVCMVLQMTPYRQDNEQAPVRAVSGDRR